MVRTRTETDLTKGVKENPWIMSRKSVSELTVNESH